MTDIPISAPTEEEGERSKLKIEYQVIRLDSVVRHFVKGFVAPPEDYQWYIDPVKGVLILRLYVRTPDAR